MTRHFHAYAYTGRAFTDGQVLKGEAPSNYAPFLIADWLARPARTIAESFTDPEQAAKWLRGEMEAHPPIDAESFSIDTRMGYAESTLRQERGADVVWGYYAKGQYVSRAVICCPRVEAPQPGKAAAACPEGRG
ncbi:hypothetical protein ACFY0G_02430 [Streptomyces sp. NPDC001552]|uniref:hypothetical protein n=1 Tax=Streptomyces sp. NPDC001552 TaxID=3364587 RepID=UPI0036D09B90